MPLSFRQLKAILMICAAGLTAGLACTDPIAPPPAVATVTLGPQEGSEIPVGGTVMLVAVAKDASGATLTDRTTAWSSSDPLKASVVGGLVSGVAVGNATITATVDGKAAGVEIRVREGAVIGASGGSVTALDGVVRVVVPAGAFGANANLTVSSPASAPSSSRLIQGTTFVLGLGGLTPSQPVALTVKYDPSRVTEGNSEGELQLYELVGGAWTVVAGSSANTTEKTVAATVSRAGVYAIMNPARVQTVTIAGDLTPIPVITARQLSAVLKDIDGAAVTRPVTWSSSDSAILSIGTSTGLASAKVPGSVTVTATSDGKSGTVTLNVVPGAPAKLIAWAGNNQSVPAGEVVPTPPSVLVTDAGDNPIANVAVTFAVTAGGGSVTGGSATTNAQGIAAVGSWRLGSVAGPNTLVATSAAVSGVTITFQAAGGVGAPAKLIAFSGNNATATAGGLVSTLPTVRVTDAAGNFVPGVPVKFEPGSGSGSVTGAEVLSDAGGLARPGTWRLGPTPGPQSLIASSAGLEGSPISFAATAVAPVASRIAGHVGNNQTARPGNAVATAPAVIVTDPEGIPVPGVAVTFAVTAGGGTIEGASATTNADGVAAVARWTLGSSPGANTLTASAAGLSGSPVTFNAIAALPSATAMAIAAGNNQSGSPGAALPVAPAVRLTDVNGAGVAGALVNFVVTGGGGSIAGGTATSNADGIATAGTWTLGGAQGSNVLVATTPDLPGVSVTFHATAGPPPPARIEPSDGYGQSAPVNTFVPTPPTVLVTDASGNPVSGYTVTFSIGSGGGTVGGAIAVTDAFGIARSAFWKLGPVVGTQTLLATAPGVPGSPVAIIAHGTAAVAASMVVSSGNNQTARPGNAVATAPAVVVRDIDNAPVAGITVTFSVTGGGGSVTGATAVSGQDGVAAVGSWTLGGAPGPNTLRASAGGLSVTFNATAALPGAATMAIASGNNQSGLAGQPVSVAPAVKITDADGNPVSGVSVTFSVLSGGGSITGANTVSNASGMATLGSWTLGIGANSLSATSAGLNGNPLTFFATGAAEVQIVTFGDSNTDIGFSGTNSTPVVASYISSSNPSIRLSPTAPHSSLQLAGKIELRWKANSSRSIKVTNHGISATTSGSGRTQVGAPNALEQVGGISRFRGEVMGDAYPWSGGEPTNDFYPTGPIARVQAFVPRTSDFAYVSTGTNDVGQGVPNATIAANLAAMISEWTGRGLPANKFIITTIPPRAPGLSGSIPDLNARIRTLAANTGVRLVDLSSFVSSDDGLTWKPGMQLDGDPLHYSEAVRNWIADQVVSIMLSF